MCNAILVVIYNAGPTRVKEFGDPGLRPPEDEMHGCCRQLVAGATPYHPCKLDFKLIPL